MIKGWLTHSRKIALVLILTLLLPDKVKYLLFRNVFASHWNYYFQAEKMHGYVCMCMCMHVQGCVHERDSIV